MNIMAADNKIEHMLLTLKQFLFAALNLHLSICSLRLNHKSKKKKQNTFSFALNARGKMQII